MIAKIELPLDGAMREEIVARMSEAMGGYIEALEKPDFSDWNADDWMRFVGVAFDICAPAVFMKRVVVVPPAEIEYLPPYPVE